MQTRNTHFNEFSSRHRKISGIHDAAIQNYNCISPWYDHISGRRERSIIKTGIQRINIRRGESVLEIGCGTGYGLVVLAHRTTREGRVAGVDISSGMLARARRKIQKKRVSEWVKLYLDDALCLKFQDDFFDAVFMSFTLELFPESEMGLVLRECRRVLRKDGRLGVVAMSSQGHHGWLYRCYERLHHRFPHVIDCRPIPVAELLCQSGFQIVEKTVTSLWSLPVEVVLAKKDESSSGRKQHVVGGTE
jgi:ubiquinone/menaquinone biosynthesis C-methylase UbiE